ncbi:MAG: hypothetical protein ACMG6S_30930, partial [Byssovorax sp.]
MIARITELVKLVDDDNAPSRCGGRRIAKTIAVRRYAAPEEAGARPSSGKDAECGSSAPTAPPSPFPDELESLPDEPESLRKGLESLPDEP